MLIQILLIYVGSATYGIVMGLMPSALLALRLFVGAYTSGTSAWEAWPSTKISRKPPCRWDRLLENASCRVPANAAGNYSVESGTEQNSSKSTVAFDLLFPANHLAASD